LKSLGKTDPFFKAVAELVLADGQAARDAIIQRHPELASERGATALELTLSFAIMAGFVMLLPALQELQAWLRELQKPAAARPSAAPDAGSGPHALIGQFIEAAINADQTYLRTRDLTEVRRGIEVWEQIVAQGILSDAPPESLVDAYITVAMLYARRYEVDTHREDLDRAFGFLRRAEEHVIPGSHNDVLIKMSSATWLMLRFQMGKDRADLDQAIAGYGDVIAISPPESVNSAVASANLGRALLMRHRLTGAARDRRRGIEMLSNAALHLPRDHPALPSVQQGLAFATLQSGTES
jgi:hypothetical protein